MDIRKFISENILVLDGAMGTMLQKHGLKAGELPETMNITNPDIVKNIHLEYFKAGSKMVMTNTLGANQRKLSSTGYSVNEIIEQAVCLAKEAAREYDGYVALDISSIGELLEPMGTLKFDEAYELYKTQVVAGVNAGVDAIMIETMSDLLELKCAILAAKENSVLPVFCTMTFEKNMRTFMGAKLSSMAVTLDGLGVDAIGVNCSVGPGEMQDMIRELMKWTNLPVIAKPNAGIPTLVNGETVFNMNAEEFAEKMNGLLELGAGIVGGCCGTTPDFIKQLSSIVQGKGLIKRDAVEPCAVCSYAKTVSIDRIRIIGERINPTSKKNLQQALLSGSAGDFAVKLAVQQAEAGADILDVNVGFPAVDEEKAMIEVIKNIQSCMDIPLQIDSSKPEVIEAALRIYNGKPIINSVNGEAGKLKSILPLAKKYGAAVIGLTLDENGIPKTAHERYKIAEKIVAAALEHGIPRRDIFIDCLTLTAGAQQEIAYESIDTIAMVKKKLNVKTVMGISNISFGLPARERINQVFLSLALANGLDLPIINPNITEMIDTVYCFHQLKNIDAGSVEYVNRFNKAETQIKPQSVRELDISYCIEHGLKDEIKPVIESLLEHIDALAIISGSLIPALDIIGTRYEQGKIFLPQLLRSAEAAKAAFEIVRKRLPPNTAQDNNKIILATVKGDIHDIGKNIVKTVLENYGFAVIDLGYDVDIELICDTAVKHGVRLIGLSALMTTTVESMEKTIRAVKAVKKDVLFMVGGAVLTEGLSKRIGADFYAKDVMDGVSIAKKVFDL